MSRQSERRGHEPEVRISWLEDDMDRVDREFEETFGKIEHAKGNWKVVAENQDRKIDRIEAAVDGNRRVLVGLLLSTLSVAVTIVAQILLVRGGS